MSEMSDGASPTVSAFTSGATGGGDGGGEAKSHLFVFTAHKAGMAADRERVNRVVYEMSKDSAFYKNQERLDEHTQR